jgi:hypothetical protein
MRKMKETILSFSVVAIALAFFSCGKEIEAHNSAGTAQTAQTEHTLGSAVYYTNNSKAMYVVEFISTDTRKVFTSILSPGAAAAKLAVPVALGSGNYNIVLTPEGSNATITTHYEIGGISGVATAYPATIRNAYITLNDASSVSITLN